MLFLLFRIVSILQKESVCFLANLVFSFFGDNDHLKYFQEEVDVKPPDAKALSDDSKEEGDADDEEDGRQKNVDGREDQKLQKHSHLWNVIQIDYFQIVAGSWGTK